MSNVLSTFYQAVGFTLSWGAGSKTLVTGEGPFAFHFSPMSTRLARTPFGATSAYLGVCDRGKNIRAGDFLVLTAYGGSGIAPRRMKVDGVQDHFHSFGLLDHMNLALSEYVEY